MPSSCCAYNCSVRCKGGSGITFHSFPFRDKDLLSQWVRAIGREHFVPSKSMKLCSQHFEDKWFYESNGRRCLLNKAVPSIFNFDHDSAKHYGRKKILKTRECFVVLEPISDLPRKMEEEQGGSKGIKRELDEEDVVRAKIPHFDFVASTDHDLTKECKGIYEIPSLSENSHNDDDDDGDDKSAVIQDVKKKLAASLADIKMKLTSDVSHNIMRSLASERQFAKSQSKLDFIKLRDRAYPEEDKVTTLSDNSIHFEFAKPKKQFILKLNKLSNPPAYQDIKSETLDDLLVSLLENKLLSYDGYDLMSTFSEIPESLCRKKNKQMISRAKKKFSEYALNFATSLYLSSLAAFFVLDKIFHMPSRSIVQKRLRVQCYRPGFTQESLDILTAREYSGKADRMCSLMLSSVYIKRRRDFEQSSNTWIGHLDISCGQNFTDIYEIPLASEVLVFIVVGLFKEWKLPIGYFLHNGMSGNMLQRLVEEAIHLLDDCGLNVKAVVCKGNTNCIKMAQLLGCQIQARLKYCEMTTSFLHPSGESTSRISVIFDTKHSLNLLLKLFEEKGTLQSSKYGNISWECFKPFFRKTVNQKPEYVSHLHPLHFDFHKLKRIIRLCSMQFSPMLSKAIELADELKMHQYVGCDAAACFATDIHSALELLNSRSPLATEGKSPIQRHLIYEQVESMNDIAERLLNLKMSTGEAVVDTGRWTAVSLFAFTLKSVSLLTGNMMKENNLEYICTYRLNLDHTDMVLSHFQRHGDWNSNPSAKNFKKAYKALFESSYGKLFHIHDFEGNDLTVEQGLIYPFKDERSFDDEYEIKDWTSTFDFLVDLDMEVTKKSEIALRNLSQRLSCPDCMTVMIDCHISDSIKNGRANINALRPSRFVLRLVKIVEREWKCFLTSLRTFGKEELVLHIFHEFVELQRVFVVDVENHHAVEEPHHFIALIKAFTRCYISPRYNRLRDLRRFYEQLKYY